MVELEFRRSCCGRIFLAYCQYCRVSRSMFLKSVFFYHFSPFSMCSSHIDLLVYLLSCPKYSHFRNSVLAVPSAWNSFPPNRLMICSFTSFKSLLKSQLFRETLCNGLNCAPPPEIHMLKLWLPNVTIFEDLTFTEVIKVNWSHKGGALIWYN